jgi:hypothetical protein
MFDGLLRFSERCGESRLTPLPSENEPIAGGGESESIAGDGASELTSTRTQEPNTLRRSSQEILVLEAQIMESCGWEKRVEELEEELKAK